MKKLILLGAMLLASSYSLVAEQTQSKEIALEVENNDITVEKKEIGLYPKNHKTFFLSIDNQTKLLNKLLESKGKNEVIRYFLSLKNHDNKKALDLLGKSGNEDLRLVILENLPTDVFAEILNTLFEGIGGEAIAGWGYKFLEGSSYSPAVNKFYYGVPDKDLYFMPSVRAQQYVNFFMQYEVSHRDILGKAYEDNKEVVKLRGQKMAEVLNQMDEDKVIELLYGRIDTCFCPANSKIVKADSNGCYQGQVKVDNTCISDAAKCELGIGGYYYLLKGDNGKYSMKYLDAFKILTTPSRVFSKNINCIVPYLNTKLIVSIFEKETKGDIKALVELIKSLGCDKAFELFEYLEDSVKDKVYESCSEDGALFDMLGFEGDEDDILAIESGESKKEL